MFSKFLLCIPALGCRASIQTLKYNHQIFSLGSEKYVSYAYSSSGGGDRGPEAARYEASCSPMYTLSEGL